MERACDCGRRVVDVDRGRLVRFVTKFCGSVPDLRYIRLNPPRAYRELCRPAATKGGFLDARGLLRQGAQEGRDQRRQTGDDEERASGDPGRLPGLRDEDLQDRQTRIGPSLRSI